MVERWIFIALSETNFWPHSGHSIFFVSIGSYFGAADLLARLAARLLVLLFLSSLSSSAARLELLSLAPNIRDSISVWDTVTSLTQGSLDHGPWESSELHKPQSCDVPIPFRFNKSASA